MVETAVSKGVTVHSLHFHRYTSYHLSRPTKGTNFNTLRSKAYDADFTSCVPPAGHPAVVPWFKVDLLARQAGIADEVTGQDVRASFNQSDVIV